MSTSHPSCCLVLVGDGVATAVPSTQTALEQVKHAGLDEIARQGCCGELMLEDLDLHGTTALRSRFFQLLGIRLNHPLDAAVTKKYLADFYQQPRLGIVSNSQEIVQTAESLGFSIARFHEDLDSGIVGEVSGLVGQGNADILFCWLVKEGPGATAAACIQLLGDIANDTKDQKGLLRVVVAGYGDDLKDSVKEAVIALHPRHPAEICGFKLPVQSSQVYNREVVRTQAIPLYVSYYHHETTRRDNATKFTEEECRKGGNGRILAYHFLPEIGFLLGRRPKYGA